MKDKLYKTNHKAPYYISRNILLSLSLIICCGAIFAIPTYFSINAKKVDQANLAQENTINNDEGNIENYLSYNN